MHVHNRRPAWLLVTPVPPLLLLLLLVITPRQSAAYSNNPFQGQGVAPPGSVKIYLTILLERVLEVNQVNYGFQAITYFYFSWHDPRAKAAIAEYSAAQNDPGYNNGNGCMRFCDNAFDPPWGSLSGPNMTSSRQCCDGVWLPTFSFRNANQLPEGRPEPLYAIVVAPDNETVTWRLTVNGLFFTPMDFHRFPFDTQDLVIEFSTTQRQPDKIVVLPSATNIKLFVRGVGDDLSTWTVRSVYIEVLPPLLGRDLISGSTAVNPDDPSPQSAVNATPAQLANAVVPHLWFCGVQIHIIVARNSVYFVWVGVVPVFFLTYIAHVTQFMGPSHLNERITVLITLLLALVALQWLLVADLPNSSYLLPTSQLVLLAYTCIGFMVMVSVMVYYICCYKQLRAERLQEEATLKRYKSLRSTLRTEESMAPDNEATRRNSSSNMEHITADGRSCGDCVPAIRAEHAELHSAAEERAANGVMHSGTAGASSSTGPVLPKHGVPELQNNASTRAQRRCPNPLAGTLTRIHSCMMRTMLYRALLRRKRYLHIVLMDEEFARVMARRVDGWCYLFTFCCFNGIAAILLAVPQLIPLHANYQDDIRA